MLPTSLPEREKWTPLIAAVLAAEDGALVDATECGRGVPCGDLVAEAPKLVQAVEDLLDAYNVDDPGADLKLTISGRYATVEGAVDYEGVNSAQRAFRELATAVCADRLRAADLTAIVYAEDALEEAHVRHVWSLLMRLPEVLNLQPSATLAVIAGDGQVDFDTHCSGNPSLRYRLIEPEGLLRRHTHTRAVDPIQQLARYSAADMPLMVLFLGAGASVAEGLPTGDTLRNQALGQLMGRSVDRGNFDAVARAWWLELGRNDGLSAGEIAAGIDRFVETLTLERVLEREQQIENQTFSTTLRDFARKHAEVITSLEARSRAGGLDDDPLRRILRARQRLVLLTVNFDRVLEVRAGDAALHPIVTEGDLGDFETYLPEYLENGGPIPLVKLHGDIDDPDTIVANLRETGAGLSHARDRALLALISALEEKPIRPWWYVGYSMRDRDLDTTWKSPRFHKFQEHWVAPFLDPSVERFIKENRQVPWERASRPQTAYDRLISLTASDFFDEFAGRVTSRWSSTSP